jgi:hypothetical protein
MTAGKFFFVFPFDLSFMTFATASDLFLKRMITRYKFKIIIDKNTLCFRKSCVLLKPNSFTNQKFLALLLKGSVHYSTYILYRV